MTKKTSEYTAERLEGLDPEFFLAIMRRKAHATVEFPLYQAIYASRKLPANFGNSLRHLLEIWERRGLPTDREDVAWCYALLRLADQVKARKKPQIPGRTVAFSEEEELTIDQVIRTRRSIRVWQDNPVPRELVEKVLVAGLWAPHSCNLQTIRYVVLEGAKAKWLHGLKPLRGWHACIIVAQDMRPYEYFAKIVPAHNQDLECGAAVQNMLLRAHSLGLGGVWLTFVRGEVDALHQDLDLPEYIRLRTYVGLGWPAQRGLPPGRIGVKDAVLAWR